MGTKPKLAKESGLRAGNDRSRLRGIYHQMPRMPIVTDYADFPFVDCRRGWSQRLNITKPTLQKWEDRGILKVHREGRNVLIYGKDMAAFLRKQAKGEIYEQKSSA
jgi:hypothetical protein